MSWLTLAGQLPFGGPGNYYVTVLLQLVIALPLLFAWYRQSPRTFFWAAVLLDLGFETACLAFAVDPYVYAAGLPRFLVAVALGFAFSEADRSLFRSPPMVAGAALALVYLLAFQLTGWLVPFMRPEWQPENLIGAAYALLLVYVALRFLPSAPSRWSAWLAGLGVASYHIFLVQMLYFSFWPRFGRLSLLLDLAFPLVAGWLAFVADTRLRRAPAKPTVTVSEATA